MKGGDVLLKQQQQEKKEEMKKEKSVLLQPPLSLLSSRPTFSQSCQSIGCPYSSQGLAHLRRCQPSHTELPQPALHFLAGGAALVQRPDLVPEQQLGQQLLLAQVDLQDELLDHRLH